ncbi:MAG: LicD family protein [Bacteroidaceae bacterium]|nr:LicD family protein [Bacteroidaceae bacterium]
MRLITEAKYDIRMLQLKLLPVLQCIDNVCREHRLRYYLCAGTMLGAVRNKGFIEWDDDVDICMPRPDYEVLMKHCHEWLPDPMEIIAPHNRPDYPYPFAKIIDNSTTVVERPDFMFLEGIYIDIFPIDGMSADPKAQRKHMKTYRLWRHLLFLRGRDPYKHGHGPKAWLPLLLHKTFSLKWLQDKVNRIMQTYDYETSDMVIDHDFYERGIMPKAILGQAKTYEFEQLQLCGVEDFDGYLTHLYNDYMTPPPKDKQVQHCFYYLDFDTPYREVPPEVLKALAALRGKG